MRILTFSTLFPHAGAPAHGVFVENRLRHLVASGRVRATVVAPVPWFPSADTRFGAWAIHARAPAHEMRHGIAVAHPRYAVIPRVGMTCAPFLLYAGARAAVRRAVAEAGGVDLIDAHYFYPDGVAAVLLGRELGLPVVVTARGTDLNLMPRYALPRRMIRWAAAHAAGMVTVCQALKDSLVELGVAAERVRVLRNGVDLAMFRPVDRDAVRARLGLAGPVLLSVGGLIERKGHDRVIEALPALPGHTLLIAGEGPEREALAGLARRLGVDDRVRLLGRVGHDSLRDYYGAADALILASSREGWANVLLEAMACGTPVVASRVWGTPEVVASPAAGLLVDERSGAAIAAAVRRLLAAPGSRAATRAYAEGFSWDATTEGQIELFETIIGRRGDGHV